MRSSIFCEGDHLLPLWSGNGESFQCDEFHEKVCIVQLTRVGSKLLVPGQEIPFGQLAKTKHNKNQDNWR